MKGIKTHISSMLIHEIHYEYLDKLGGKATLYSKVPILSNISNGLTNR